MKCPQCQTELQIAERQGVEIDYCPSCRGVWLDRGEIDKLIERSHAIMDQVSGLRAEPYREVLSSRSGSHDDDDDERELRKHEDRGRQARRKREGFLDNIFDIFD